ncbi:hypothetical protein [Deinococcus hohokamensis]|uniref:Uncharacterized protein n=1 Tax=Deinococcus hohokamensis TaxID=309883 RepID=A0ABV9I575_9DEIO
MATLLITYLDGNEFRLVDMRPEDALAAREAYQGPGTTLNLRFFDGRANKNFNIPKARVARFEIQLTPDAEPLVVQR